MLFHILYDKKVTLSLHLRKLMAEAYKNVLLRVVKRGTVSQVNIKLYFARLSLLCRLCGCNAGWMGGSALLALNL
jgi:hypothetical protein